MLLKISYVDEENNAINLDTSCGDKVDAVDVGLDEFDLTLGVLRQFGNAGCSSSFSIKWFDHH